jgi:hypothetical protein
VHKTRKRQATHFLGGAVRRGRVQNPQAPGNPFRVVPERLGIRLLAVYQAFSFNPFYQAGLVSFISSIFAVYPEHCKRSYLPLSDSKREAKV